MYRKIKDKLKNKKHLTNELGIICCILTLISSNCCTSLISRYEKKDFQRKQVPNVVFIVLDALRADHLGCYDYKRNTSPIIDALAKRAILYKRAFASSPWTVPTHASFFTGRYPFEHGAHTFKVAKPKNNVNPLHKKSLTLAEVFKEEGYDTAAFVANAAYLSIRWQLNQGFDTYHVEKVYASTLNKHIFEWLDIHAENNFFLFINYIDTHSPYNTTPRPGFLDEPAVQDNGELLRLLYKKVMPGKNSIPNDLVQKVIDQYDTAIVNVDEQVGKLLDHLIKKGFYDDTIIFPS